MQKRRMFKQDKMGEMYIFIGENKVVNKVDTKDKLKEWG